MILRGLILPGSLVIMLLQASPSGAQVENRLAAYTGRNASGYLEPLVDAFGTVLNSGLFHSAHIQENGFHVSVEARYMSVFFGDGDRTFAAVTEHGFQPEQTAKAPTVVGAKKAVYVEGEGGTRFAFPGGFDLGSFSFAVPQLRVGTLYGTEAVLRLLFLNLGTSDLGSLNLYGFGLRHSISQHVQIDLPVDMSVGLFWQRFSVGKNKGGDELLEANAFSFGVHVSKRLERMEPYAGFSYDRFSMAVDYQAESENSADAIDLSFDSNEDLHAALGVSYNLAFMTVQCEYNIASQTALSFGFSLNND